MTEAGMTDAVLKKRPAAAERFSLGYSSVTVTLLE
jgi:hypothetical protein